MIKHACDSCGQDLDIKIVEKYQGKTKDKNILGATVILKAANQATQHMQTKNKSLNFSLVTKHNEDNLDVTVCDLCLVKELALSVGLELVTLEQLNEMRNEPIVDVTAHTTIDDADTIRSLDNEEELPPDTMAAGTFVRQGQGDDDIFISKTTAKIVE